jgi:hypothetical protein
VVRGPSLTDPTCGDGGAPSVSGRSPVSTKSWAVSRSLTLGFWEARHLNIKLRDVAQSLVDSGETSNTGSH